MSQHVVIVDDDELNLRLFSSVAREIPGVVVHPFRASLEALEWCRGQDVDCFILNSHLPPPDGLTMIHLLRGIDAFTQVPIVIVTGEHERELCYGALDAGANDFVQKPVDDRELVARLTNLLSLRKAQKRLGRQIGSLEASLLASEERARQHAERLEAIWRIANNPMLQDEELVLAMLGQAAMTIRPGQDFVGLLGRIEGADLVTAAVAGAMPEQRGGALRVGTRVRVEDTLIGDTLRAGGTRSWSDLQTDRDLPEHALGRGWRAVISANFTAGGSLYALTFASGEPASRAFGDLDHTYVEILTEFFASRMQQQWLAARIRDQVEHDSLTALSNRTRFRSVGRALLRAGEPCAVAVIDVVNFHQLNEAHGHLTGDAVLVEIAAALGALAADEEVVARVGGDSFAVFFPTVTSRASLMASVTHYCSVFGAPIGIGDRHGKETVSVEAVAGVALTPDDGSTLDELLFRAEARADPLAAGPNTVRFG